MNMRRREIRRRARRTEAGYALVFLSITLVVLLIVAAIVVDLSFLRNDRRADQKVTDAAASAGAVALASGSGVEACQTALDFVVANLPSVSSLSGADCSGFPASCAAATTPTASTTGTSGPYTVTVVYPVDDGHPFMTTASAIGAPPRTVSPADGSRCDRIGVALSLERGPSFASIIDDSPKTTSVHTVALAGGAGTRRPINLLILERTECQAAQVDGSSAELTVGAIVDGTETFPGVLAIDSDGSAPNCSSGRGTLNVESATVRADGPPGCATELTPGSGEGCGEIALFASGVPGPASPGGCLGLYWPACTSNAAGTVLPDPVRMGTRFTRAPIDHRFNCKASYSSESWFSEQPIDGCSDASNPDLDYVDELSTYARGSVTPAGFQVYGDGPGEPCTVEGDQSVVVPEGNTHVICDPFTIKGPVTFTGGNVIFNGDVVVEGGSGALTVHACGAPGVDNCAPSSPLSWNPELGSDYDESEYSSDAAWVIFRSGGTIRKAGGATLRIHDTAVFLPEDADYSGRNLSLEGGRGALAWSAAREGPFENLALWSDGSLDHDFAGQANLDLEGVFYVPSGRVVYQGTGSQEQVAAQFISERLRVTGNGSLVVTPVPDRAIPLVAAARSTLIR